MYISLVCCDVVLTLADDDACVTCDTGGNDTNVCVESDSVVVEGRASSWSLSLSSMLASESSDVAVDLSLGCSTIEAASNKNETLLLGHLAGHWKCVGFSTYLSVVVSKPSFLVDMTKLSVASALFWIH